MRFAVLGCDGVVCERELPLLPVFQRLDARLDVMVSCCDQWIDDVDFCVALVVSTWEDRVCGMLSAWRDSRMEMRDSRDCVLATFASRSRMLSIRVAMVLACVVVVTSSS